MAIQPGISAQQSAVFRSRRGEFRLDRPTIDTFVRIGADRDIDPVRGAWSGGETTAATGLDLVPGGPIIAGPFEAGGSAVAVAGDAVARGGVLSDLSRQRTDPKG